VSELVVNFVAARVRADTLAELAALPTPILVLGGQGYDNAGDEAMLDGLLHILGREVVSVVSRRPEHTASLHHVRTVGPAGLPMALLRHRTLLIGGGALFGRDMGILGRLLPFVGLVALAVGRTVALAGIGVDDKTPRVMRPFLALLGRHARLVQVRDRASVAFLAGLGVPSSFAPDFSEFVEPASPETGRAVLEAAGVPVDRTVVGLALTAVEPTLAAKVEAAMPEWLAAYPDASFVLIPTSRHPFVKSHDDLVFARRLAAANPSLFVVPGPLAPATMLALFSSLDAAVGMRYHALHFAQRAGVPVVPLAYAPKCLAWCTDEGVAPASVDTIVARLGAALSVGAALHGTLPGGSR
jgi:polysaccharide pyruvyl transferase WcaK-like protein